MYIIYRTFKKNVVSCRKYATTFKNKGLWQEGFVVGSEISEMDWKTI